MIWKGCWRSFIETFLFFIYEETKTGEIKHTILLIFFICFCFIYLEILTYYNITWLCQEQPLGGTCYSSKKKIAHLMVVSLAFPRTTRAWMELLSVKLPLLFLSHFIPELQNQEGWERGRRTSGKWVRGK